MRHRMPPRSPASVSIWHFNLAHELVATAVAVLALVGGSWFILDQLERRYLQLHQQDAERVGQLLQEHLLEARQQLDRFAARPADPQPQTTELLLPPFSDIYRLNANLQVVTVMKSSPGSRVFPGFSFAGTHINPYLQQPRTSDLISSTIDRGVEDERASVYFSGADRSGQRLLARLDLSYLQDFLNRYQRSSGLPLLLVNRHGFVMLSSDPNLIVPAVDLRDASSQASSTRSIYQNHQRWLPLVTRNSGMGGHIATLIPADPLEAQRRLVWLSTMAVGSLVLLMFFWKNHRLHNLLFRQVVDFSAQIEQLRLGVAKGETNPVKGARVPSQFLEILRLEQGFQALVDAIQSRDLMLQQKLRTSLTAATIAHEINLPLSTIRMRCLQADVQLRDGELNPAAIQELVHSLQVDSQVVSGVIEKMRMLLRNVQTELVPIELGEVVSSSLTLLKRPLREHQVQLCCVGLADSGRLVVRGDAVQLQVAVSNLIRNAIEAVAELPPEKRLILVNVRRDGDWVQVGVADSGAGFRGDVDTDTLLCSSKPGGTGLGLFVVRTALTNHGGSLQIGHSKELGGAEVWMILPLAEDPQLSGQDGQYQEYQETVMRTREAGL